jgi:hypothetical protein
MTTPGSSTCQQAPLEWHHTINKHLITNHFMPTNTNPCLYIHVAGGLISFLALYVDNCTIVAHPSQLHGIKEIMAHLAHASQLDIMFAVLQLSQFTNNFGNDMSLPSSMLPCGTHNLAICYN